MPCLLPVAAHAQAQVSPDSYEILNAETITTQPVQVAANTNLYAGVSPLLTGSFACDNARFINSYSKSYRLEIAFADVSGYGVSGRTAGQEPGLVFTIFIL